MKGNYNPKIVGSAIIGFALVAGSYVVSNFNAISIPQQASVLTTKPAPRLAIEVSDEDSNGIEDWRDDFVTTKSVVLEDSNTTTYVPPDTLTGKMGIDFMQDIILSKGYGPFGRSKEEVIEETVNTLSKETAHDLYDTPDITIMNEWIDMDIANYANTVAGTIMRNNVPNVDNEIIILKNLLESDDEGRITELRTLAESYRRSRDEMLKIPVPVPLVKEHLDLINTSHAIHKDIDAMTLAINDPAFTLLRLKRYRDDAAGLGYAMQNMYLSLEPYASSFSVNDPAVLFILFSPNYQN